MDIKPTVSIQDLQQIFHDDIERGLAREPDEQAVHAGEFEAGFY